MSGGMEWIVRFELPNGGAGPETVASDELATEFDAVVVLLLRDHYCQLSRQQAQAYSDAVEEFESADVGVVAALPDSEGRAAYWGERYGLEIPVLADSAAQLAGTDAGGNAEADASQPAAMTDGTNRFDTFVDAEAAVESLPAIGVLDATSEFPRLIYCEGGDDRRDCPEPAEALSIVEAISS